MVSTERQRQEWKNKANAFILIFYLVDRSTPIVDGKTYTPKVPKYLCFIYIYVDFLCINCSFRFEIEFYGTDREREKRYMGLRAHVVHQNHDIRSNNIIDTYKNVIKKKQRKKTFIACSCAVNAIFFGVVTDLIKMNCTASKAILHLPLALNH